MKKQEYFLVFDCGATSIKAVALNPHGDVISIASFAHAPQSEKGGHNYLIWDLEGIWRKICLGSKQIISSAGKKVLAVSVITFGADGAPVGVDGNLTYPIISWRCSRTEALAKKITELISAREIFRITGYQVMPFNTIFKLWWLKENVPAALDKAKYFLMLPGILNFRFTGEMTIDYTSASTTMLFDIKEGGWSKRLLSLIDLNANFFPRMVKSGEIIGRITKKASEETGIPKGTPVTAAGHDTQFAIIGSLADDNDLVLSSGTWEIAAIRLPFFQDTETAFSSGMVVELDAEMGFWNPQILMIAGGVVEWMRYNLFADYKDERDVYARIVEAASSITPGAGGVFFIPSFMPAGPLKPYGTQGTIVGLNLNTDRIHIARAVFEGLAFQLRHAVDIMFEAFNFKPEKIVVVGGGSKNAFWNRVRADVLNLPVVVGPCEEAAALGAALFAMIGIGYAKNLKEAKAHITRRTTKIFNPSYQREIYDELYVRYRKLPLLLSAYYREKT